MWISGRCDRGPLATRPPPDAPGAAGTAPADGGRQRRTAPGQHGAAPLAARRDRAVEGGDEHGGAVRDRVGPGRGAAGESTGPGGRPDSGRAAYFHWVETPKPAAMKPKPTRMFQLRQLSTG
ncbi:hypothetical protein GCM10010495_09030 [Kitasatospora herbaricolor]|nr:hypothetical protein GCM10010495_09030 [Kitasatospora herbaricolor]